MAFAMKIAIDIEADVPLFAQLIAHLTSTLNCNAD